ncbi:hypothetical protein HanRHA438_Chr03g0140971 [Helianthus annuus]|nr:hypothetical protein HanIR_Chr03g0140761 [Helianthus annuus]KAJ0937330.1 hypothetical protein HanRHA438_Chr03g0140971 [Helianthus annuus]
MSETPTDCSKNFPPTRGFEATKEDCHLSVASVFIFFICVAEVYTKVGNLVNQGKK